MVIDDNRSTHSAIGLAAAIRLHAIEPRRLCSHIVGGGQVDACTTLIIQGVQIIQSQGVGSTWNGLEVDLWFCVFKLGANVRWEVWILRLYPYIRC